MMYPGYAKICARYFSDEKPAFATTLVAILLRCYGADFLNWESASLTAQIKDDFGVDLSRKTHDKIQALVTTLTTTQAYQDAETFGQMVNCLNGKGISSLHGPQAPVDVAWAVAEMELADPQPEGIDPSNRWSRAIKGYIRVILDDAGLSIKPKSLSMAAERSGTTGSANDAETFAAAWQSKQLMADEVDQAVAKRMSKLLEQLRAVGVPVQLKQAELDPEPVKVSESRKTAANTFTEDSEPIQVSKVAADPRKEALGEAMAIGSRRAKRAEWTSEANQGVHVDKHSGEFGGPEGYIAAEAEHSTNPPADSKLREVRCKPAPDGSFHCSKAMYSPSKGTVHVKTLEDGRTVTLYRVHAPNVEASA